MVYSRESESRMEGMRIVQTSDWFLSFGKDVFLRPGTNFRGLIQSEFCLWVAKVVTWQTKYVNPKANIIGTKQR